VTRAADARLGAYAVFAAAALVGALALRRTELAAMATPFAVLVALGVRARPPRLRAWFELDRARALEGDVLDATVTVRSDQAVDRLEIGLALPEGIELEDGRNPGALRLAGGEERELPLRLRCVRWSSVEIGEVWLRARDRIGLVRFEDASIAAGRCGSTPRPSGCAASSPRRTRRQPRAPRSRGFAERGSSSPTRGPSSRATACGRSTGVRRLGAAASS
jgi:hypothetical protein